MRSREPRANNPVLDFLTLLGGCAALLAIPVVGMLLVWVGSSLFSLSIGPVLLIVLVLGVGVWALFDFIKFDADSRRQKARWRQSYPGDRSS